MEYKEIIEMSAEAFNQRAENLYPKCRNRKYALPRQVSIVMGETYLKLNDYELTHPFDLVRCGVANARKSVYNLMDTDRAFRLQIQRLSMKIKRKIESEANFGNLKILPAAVEHKMLNKRAILSKTDQGWIILLKRLNGKTIEKKHLVISDEAMTGIIESYKILNTKP